MGAVDGIEIHEPHLKNPGMIALLQSFWFQACFPFVVRDFGFRNHPQVLGGPAAFACGASNTATAATHSACWAIEKGKHTSSRGRGDLLT